MSTHSYIDISVASVYPCVIKYQHTPEIYLCYIICLDLGLVAKCYKKPWQLVYNKHVQITLLAENAATVAAAQL